MQRFLIVNADDLGASPGVNRGILEAHERGIVTSASLMVDRAAAADAVASAARAPGLSVGLHFEHPEREGFDLANRDSARAEITRQLDRFEELTGRKPTHIDSHHHVHRAPGVVETFAEIAEELRVPLREASPVTFIGGFYAQWEWEVTELHYVSVEFLEQILRTEMVSEWTELGCHPGYVDDSYNSVYLSEREEELRTLTNPRVRTVLDEIGIGLKSYADFV